MWKTLSVNVKQAVGKFAIALSWPRPPHLPDWSPHPHFLEEASSEGVVQVLGRAERCWGGRDQQLCPTLEAPSVGCDGAARPGKREPGLAVSVLYAPTPMCPFPISLRGSDCLVFLGFRVSPVETLAFCPTSLLGLGTLLGRDHTAFLRLNSPQPWSCLPVLSGGSSMAVCLSSALRTPQNEHGLLCSDR